VGTTWLAVCANWVDREEFSIVSQIREFLLRVAETDSMLSFASAS